MLFPVDLWGRLCGGDVESSLSSSPISCPVSQRHCLFLHLNDSHSFLNRVKLLIGGLAASSVYNGFMSTWTLRPDFSEVHDGIKEAQLLISENLSQIPLEVVELLLDSLEVGLEVAGTEHHTAAGTRELLIRFQLPERFRKLVSAI